MWQKLQLSLFMLQHLEPQHSLALNQENTNIIIYKSSVGFSIDKMLLHKLQTYKVII